MKRYLLFIVLLAGCNSARKALTTVRLDSTKSFISNGNGKGYFTKWQWDQIVGEGYPIINSDSAVASTQVKQGLYSWRCTLWDNLGQSKADTISLMVQ